MVQINTYKDIIQQQFVFVNKKQFFFAYILPTSLCKYIFIDAKFAIFALNINTNVIIISFNNNLIESDIIL